MPAAWEPGFGGLVVFPGPGGLHEGGLQPAIAK